jgi:thiaminase
MELRLHGAYARSWDVDLDVLERIEPATQDYTDFLISIAEDPEVIEGAAGGRRD